MIQKALLAEPLQTIAHLPCFNYCHYCNLVLSLRALGVSDVGWIIARPYPIHPAVLFHFLSKYLLNGY